MWNVRADSGETHNGRALYAHATIPRCVFQYEASYGAWDACIREGSSGPSACFSSSGRVLASRGGAVPLTIEHHWTEPRNANFSIEDLSSECNVAEDPASEWGFCNISHSNAGQWAARIDGFSSEYNHPSFHASQVLGPPDLYPKYGDAPNSRDSPNAGRGAWSPLYTFTGLEFLELSFQRAVVVGGVHVYETKWPGGLVSVLVWDAAGRNWDQVTSPFVVLNVVKNRTGVV